MRTESSLAVGVAEVHALGGWGYPAADARANRMVGGAHHVHALEFSVHVRVFHFSAVIYHYQVWEL